MTAQIPLIGVFMIVNGSLCVLYGLFMMAIGPLIMRMQPPNQGNAPPAEMMTFIVLLYVGLGILNATPGVFNIVAGVMAQRYRSRTFVMVALISNVGTLFSCYCLPTSVGLMIWGLIAVLQPDGIKAFKLAETGMPADEIKERMSRRRYRDAYHDYDDDDDRRNSASFDRPLPKPDRGDDGIQEIK